jgi:glycosyltransferase involved in cell wall biosynthesis
MARVLYVYSRRNTFTRIDLEALRGRFEVEEYFQNGALPRPRELVAKLRRCDVVFGWFASWHTLAALNLARALGKPSVLVIGGFDTASLPEIGYGNQQDPIRRRRARLAMRRATRLVTNSDYSRREIERNIGIPPEQVTVVHHGLADRFGDPGEGERDRVALTVGVVDTLNLERKGMRPFVRAAALLPEVEFVLAGKWNGDAVEALRADAGPNVALTGFLSDEDLDAEFRRAAVYVQASMHEGFGLSLAEGMLAGCVPVVTDVTALPEVVGDTGVRIASPTPEAVAAGVRQALEMGASEGARARARILERFPLSARAEGICAEVEAALG